MQEHDAITLAVTLHALRPRDRIAISLPLPTLNGIDNRGLNERIVWLSSSLHSPNRLGQSYRVAHTEPELQRRAQPA